MKTRNPYAPLRYFQGIMEAMKVCPTWRMIVTSSDSGGKHFWGERDHTGSFWWREGPPPVPAGIVCDENWIPVEFQTGSGRTLPNLRMRWTEDDSNKEDQ